MEMINVSELLKDCPKDMELDCTMFDAKVTYQGLSKRIPTHPIVVQTEHGFEFELTQYGQIHNIVGSRCVIFPKGKTTWEGFVPPCKFKDGDIVYIKTNVFEHIFIFKVSKDDKFIEGYASLSGIGLYLDGCSVCEVDDVKEIRFATEAERAKLFDTIKARDYHWNNETKTLEKLIQPIFKAGNKVRNKNNHNIVFTITSLEEDCYICGTKLALWFDDQDKYELVPYKFDISTLKPFDKVLVRDNDKGRWDIHFYELYDNENKSYPYRTLGGMIYKQCIPYEGNEHLIGLVKECDDYYKSWINEED